MGATPSSYASAYVQNSISSRIRQNCQVSKNTNQNVECNYILKGCDNFHAKCEANARDTFACSNDAALEAGQSAIASAASKTDIPLNPFSGASATSKSVAINEFTSLVQSTCKKDDTATQFVKNTVLCGEGSSGDSVDTIANADSFTQCAAAAAVKVTQDAEAKAQATTKDALAGVLIAIAVVCGVGLLIYLLIKFGPKPNAGGNAAGTNTVVVTAPTPTATASPPKL